MTEDDYHPKRADIDGHNEKCTKNARVRFEMFPFFSFFTERIDGQTSSEG
jgi:hypothetical protein